MTSITANSGRIFAFFPAALRLVAAALAPLGALTERRPAAPTQTPDWTSLDAHLLADIGETPESAEDAARRDRFWRPLGAIGGVFGPQPGSRL